MARQFWPGEDPIGERITYARAIPPDAPQRIGRPGSCEIVGIVGDVKHVGLDDADVAMFYTPQSHPPSFHTMTLVLRTDSGANRELLSRRVRRALASLDPNVPLYGVRSLDAIVERSVDSPRFRTYVIGVFAALALLLAAIGVYAVVGVSVVQRTREIGIRIALGAQGPRLVAMLVRQSMRPVAWGFALGLGGALVETRFLDSLLFRVDTADVAVYLSVVSLLALSALAATFLPTLKAMKVDPVQTLKAE